MATRDRPDHSVAAGEAGPSGQDGRKTPAGVVWVILNPTAGGGEEGEEIRAWAERRPRVRVRETSAAGDGRRWARDAAREGVDLVVAAGGDGTVHEVADGLMEVEGSGPALGVVPLGTGNDLVRSLAVPQDVEEALELLDRGRRRPMDVVRLEGVGGEPRFFLNALNGGFSGDVHDALGPELKERWGPLSYLRSGLETWGERAPYELELEVDGEVSRHEALNLVVANGGYAGHGIPVAPGADPFDGHLDVLVILDAPALELSGLAARMLTGEPVEHDLLVRWRARSVRIQAARPLPVSVDGEPDELSDASMEVRPGALPVVVGPS
jgi:diacylglycerol kinase (ATP)